MLLCRCPPLTKTTSKLRLQERWGATAQSADIMRHSEAPRLWGILQEEGGPWRGWWGWRWLLHQFTQGWLGVCCHGRSSVWLSSSLWLRLQALHVHPHNRSSTFQQYVNPACLPRHGAASQAHHHKELSALLNRTCSVVYWHEVRKGRACSKQLFYLVTLIRKNSHVCNADIRIHVSLLTLG